MWMWSCLSTNPHCPFIYPQSSLTPKMCQAAVREMFYWICRVVWLWIRGFFICTNSAPVRSVSNGLAALQDDRTVRARRSPATQKTLLHQNSRKQSSLLQTRIRRSAKCADRELCDSTDSGCLLCSSCPPPALLSTVPVADAPLPTEPETDRSTTSQSHTDSCYKSNSSDTRSIWIDRAGGSSGTATGSCS